jgi:AraC family transcriptional regulator of adaptative response/methylated-DNA-[protein]-cysteine methyltransferase
MLAVANDDGLCLLSFVDRGAVETQIAMLRRRLRRSIVPGSSSNLDKIAEELAAYFDGTLEKFTVPLDLPGTAFQVAVWHRLLEVPYGQTASYSDIARGVGRPTARRAVGQANHDNPLCIVVPCHRVVRADGSLCGYGGGLWRKKWLLDHERSEGGTDSESSARPPC